jgi:hypothetical protein
MYQFDGGTPPPSSYPFQVPSTPEPEHPKIEMIIKKKKIIRFINIF